MANMDNTTNAVYIPTIIAQKSLGLFASYMNVAKTIARDFEYAVTSAGATIQVPKRGALSVNQKAANSNVVVQNPTATNTSVTLNHHPEVTVGIDDVTKVLQNQDTLDGYALDAAIKIAEDIEGAVDLLYSSLTATPITFDATSATTIDASVRAIRKFFSDNKVPALERRNILNSTGMYNALLSVPAYVQAQNLGLALKEQGNAPLVTGSVLDTFGMTNFESQLVVATGTTPTIADHGIAYTHDAFILASRPLPDVPEGFGAVSSFIQDPDVDMGLRVLMSYNPQATSMQFTIDTLYGVAINDQRRAVEVRYTHA